VLFRSSPSEDELPLPPSPRSTPIVSAHSISSSP
jgi:hypothetical protein